MGNRWVRRGLVVTAIVAAVVALRWTVFRQEAIPVTVFRVGAGRVEETVTNSKAGTVRSRKRATLSTEVGGRVASIPVREGDRVEEGRVLLTIADGDLKAQATLQERSAQAAAAVEREACTAADQAAKDLARSEALARDAILSESIVEQARSRKETAASACEGAKAQAMQARAAVDLARVNLAKTVLRAPFPGIVSEIKTEVGEWITPSPPGMPIPSILEMIDPDDIYVSAPLDEVDVGRVKPSHPVRVSMDAYPGRTFPGKVTRVAPYVLDVLEQNRTFEIEVDLDDPAFARTLVPGSSADVEVVLRTADEVLRVPSHAILEGGKTLVARDGRLVAVPVSTGLRNWAYTEIVSGLAAGDLVVVSLEDAAVQEGARVRIAGESGP